MRSFGIKHTVHEFIAKHLGNDHFDENATLQSLGLDHQDLEDLLFRLEDEYGLTARLEDEDAFLNLDLTAGDLRKFIERLARQ
jgi:acyl carrier protein